MTKYIFLIDHTITVTMNIVLVSLRLSFLIRKKMGKIITAVILGIIALLCYILSAFQFLNKGFLFNNAYIYASKEEREKMDKKPHYKQSGIVFLLIGMLFTVNAVNAILKTNFLFFIVIVLALIGIIYAITSSILIEKRKNK